MRRLAAGLFHLDWMRVSNVFLFDGGAGSRWLVDTGHFTERPTLLLELRRLGLRPRDLTDVFLTHRHSDHAGNAAFLQSHGARIHAHPADAAVLADDSKRPPLSRGDGSFLAGLFCHVENVFPARLLVDDTHDDGERFGGFLVREVPGHTDGSLFLLHEASRALLSGDGLMTAHPPLTIRAGLCLAYPSFSADLARSRREVARVHAELEAYDTLLPGHGRALVGGARQVVSDFLTHRLGR